MWTEDTNDGNERPLRTKVTISEAGDKPPAPKPDGADDDGCSYDSPAESPPPVADRASAAVGQSVDSKTPRRRDSVAHRSSVGETVRRKIRQLYRSFGRGAGGSGGAGRMAGSGQLSAEATAASAVAAAAAAAAAPTPSTATRTCPVTGRALTGITNPSTCVSMNNSDFVQQQQQQQQHQQQQQQQVNVNNEQPLAVQPILRSAEGITRTDGGPGGDRDEDLYSVLTVDAEELRNFYTGIYVVAQCEGKRLKTKRTNKLDDIQTSFIFYRKNPTTKPIEFKMYANHLTLRRRVLIGQLSMTLQPGEPFDGMSVRRSIRERPELRTKGGSGLLFNFLSGMLHTQHLSGV